MPGALILQGREASAFQPGLTAEKPTPRALTKYKTQAGNSDAPATHVVNILKENSANDQKEDEDESLLQTWMLLQ